MNREYNAEIINKKKEHYCETDSQKMFDRNAFFTSHKISPLHERTVFSQVYLIYRKM